MLMIVSRPLVLHKINIVRSLCQLLALGGFQLTKWISNDRKVLETVPVEERAKGVYPERTPECS